MEFSITSRYKDCLSRQIGEALRINYSKDVILNSKGEYMSNTISRLSLEEDAWERKERSRVEEEQDKLDKEEVEKFRKLKTSSQLEENEPSIDPSLQGGDGSEQIEYETDEEEFGDEPEPNTGGPCHLYGGGAPHQQTNTRACGQSGQSSLQEITSFEPSLQDDDRIELIVYETDEEEFEEKPEPNTGGPCHLYGGGAPHQQTNTRACGQSGQSSIQEDPPHQSQLQPRKKPPTKSSSSKSKTRLKKCNLLDYNLGYFNLWWSRMEREGVKEEIARLKKDKENRTSERLKRLLKAGKLRKKPKRPNIIQNRPKSRAEDEDITNMKKETDYAIHEQTNVILNQPHLSDCDCQLGFPGRGVDICDQIIQEQGQDLPSSAVEEATLVLLGNSMD